MKSLKKYNVYPKNVFGKRKNSFITFTLSILFESKRQLLIEFTKIGGAFVCAWLRYQLPSDFCDDKSQSNKFETQAIYIYIGYIYKKYNKQADWARAIKY